MSESDQEPVEQEPAETAPTSPSPGQPPAVGPPPEPPGPEPGPTAESIASSLEATVVDVWNLALNLLRTFAVLIARPLQAGHLLLTDAAAGHTRYVSPFFLLTIAATLHGVFLVSFGAGGDALTESVNTIREAIEGNPARAIPAILGSCAAIMLSAWIGIWVLVRPGPNRAGAYQVLLYALSLSFIGGVVCETLPSPFHLILVGFAAVLGPALVMFGYLRSIPDARRGAKIAVFLWPIVATMVAFPMGEAAHRGAEYAVPSLTLDVATLGTIEVEEGEARAKVLLRNKTQRPLYVERASLQVHLPGGATLRPVEDAEADAWINVDDEDDESVDFVGDVTQDFEDACDRPGFEAFMTARLGGYEPGRRLHMRLRGASCRPFEDGLSPLNLPHPTVPDL
jgi:hypothetical protein